MRKSWKVHLKRSVFALSLAGLLGVGTPVKAATQEQIDEFEKHMVVSDNWLEAAPVTEGSSDQDISIAQYGAFPAQYDPRNVNGKCLVTSVKDQGNHETCWAFATMAAMETNLIKKGYANNTLDLSENHFAYFFYNRQTDRLGTTEGDFNTATRNSWDMSGGTLSGAGIAITTGAGATTENVSPYFSGYVDPSLCYRHEYSAQNVYRIGYDVNRLSQSVLQVKQAVSQFGAVATGMFMNSSYINLNNGAYYYSGQPQGNHAVTIVGWDDNYSRSNFGRIKPMNNGAWLVKNSYGPTIGDNGYLHISYEDRSLMEMMAIDAVPASMQYRNNYQYDGSANPVQMIGVGSTTSVASVYKAKGAGGKVEQLKAIMIDSLTSNVQYEVQVYSGLKSKSKPTSGTKVFSKPVKGKLSYAGYQTIKLPNPVNLLPGENFSVVVTLKSGSKSNIGVDCSVYADWIQFTSNVEENQSFVYYQGKWMDLYNMTSNGRPAPCCVRMKAFTDATNVKPTVSLTSTGVSKGSSETMTLGTKAGRIYRSATWKSSNPSVGTITSKGKFKGKKYGTTTVTATYKSGKKSKKVKCKVTVGPKKIKGFSVAANGNVVTAKWKKTAGAGGYEVVYSTSANGAYSKLATAGKKGSSASQTLNSGVYYVKMRAYKKNGKKKLWGSYTAAQKVVVR